MINNNCIYICFVCEYFIHVCLTPIPRDTPASTRMEFVCSVHFLIFLGQGLIADSAVTDVRNRRKVCAYISSMYMRVLLFFGTL